MRCVESCAVLRWPRDTVDLAPLTVAPIRRFTDARLRKPLPSAGGLAGQPVAFGARTRSSSTHKSQCGRPPHKPAISTNSFRLHAASSTTPRPVIGRKPEGRLRKTRTFQKSLRSSYKSYQTSIKGPKPSLHTYIRIPVHENAQRTISYVSLSTTEYHHLTTEYLCLKITSVIRKVKRTTRRGRKATGLCNER